MIRTSARPHVLVSFVFALSLAAMLSGCGVLGGSSGHMTVSPATATVRAGDTQQFAAQMPVSAAEHAVTPASVAGNPMSTRNGDAARMSNSVVVPVASANTSSPTPATTVTWSVNGVTGGNSTLGLINSAGLYTAPATLPAPANVTVTATSSTDNTQSANAAVSLENPIPVVASVSPNSVSVGTFTLKVTGSKFVKGAQVLVDGKAMETKFVSSTQLSATGSATQAELGKATVTVKNPDPGSATCATAASLQIGPALTIQVAVSPATVQVRDSGKQQFSATVSGTSNTAVTWSVNGTAGGNATLGTVSATGLYTAPASLPNPNTVKVTATSVADSRASASGTVTLENPIPTITSISPTSINVGNFTLTVTGTSFASGATVMFGGQVLATKFVSSTQLTATGTATDQQVGQVSVQVKNPDPGSATSNAIAEVVTTQGNLVNGMVAARFLEQSSFGPTAGSIAQVQQTGLQAYLTQQFNAPISAYKTPGSNDDLTFVQKQFFVNAVSGQDQLRQRVSFALSEIMVISEVKIGDPTAFSLWMNMLQKDAFGNFSTLLTDVTLSPAMGYYLDMGNNDGCNGCIPNENYAREILQLFSIGLTQLNPDGTPQLDGSGNPVPTYTQDTIKGFAHVFTGWSYPPGSGQKGQFYAQPNFTGPMLAYDNHHDKGAKLLLNGTTLAAGGNIQDDLTAALQNIFNHPNVGPFISKQLIQKLVTSNPSSDYVARVAQVFNDNGSGVRGDMKAVVSAILLDPEARRGDDPTQVQSSDGHLREPLLHMLAMLRAVNAQTDGADLMYYASDMRQEPFNSPTVFNFYPPDYLIPGTQLLGPEFKILNSSTLVSRINFVDDLIYGNVGNTTKTDITAYVNAAADVNKLLDMVSANLMHGQMSDGMRSTLVTALSGMTQASHRAQAALYLVGSSSQFQVEH